MSYFSLKSKIVEKLLDNPATRDNDNVLISSLLLDMEFLLLKEITAHEFLMNLSEGGYGSLDSITRCRRALQEKYPEMRGVLYKKRHQYTEDVKDQLKFEF